MKIPKWIDRFTSGGSGTDNSAEQSESPTQQRHGTPNTDRREAVVLIQDRSIGDDFDVSVQVVNVGTEEQRKAFRTAHGMPADNSDIFLGFHPPANIIRWFIVSPDSSMKTINESLHMDGSNTGYARVRCEAVIAHEIEKMWGIRVTKTGARTAIARDEYLKAVANKLDTVPDVIAKAELAYRGLDIYNTYLPGDSSLQYCHKVFARMHNPLRLDLSVIENYKAHADRKANAAGSSGDRSDYRSLVNSLTCLLETITQGSDQTIMLPALRPLRIAKVATDAGPKITVIEPEEWKGNQRFLVDTPEDAVHLGVRILQSEHEKRTAKFRVHPLSIARRVVGLEEDYAQQGLSGEYLMQLRAQTELLKTTCGTESVVETFKEIAKNSPEYEPGLTIVEEETGVTTGVLQRADGSPILQVADPNVARILHFQCGVSITRMPRAERRIQVTIGEIERLPREGIKRRR